MGLQAYTMNERPEKRALITAGCYWFVAFFLLPVFLLYLINGFQNNESVLGWVQILYYFLNALCSFFIFREHLADGLFALRFDTKKVITTVLTCAGIFLVLLCGLLLLGTYVPALAWLGYLQNAVPVSELEWILMPATLVQVNPLFGTLSLVLFTPLTVSCLLYGLGFSPACNVHPLLGYGVLLAVLALHRCLNYYSPGTIELENMMFLIQLPAHLLACVAYHRTESILAPILFHMLINLLTCILILV